jgi:hypothetical protein
LDYVADQLQQFEYLNEAGLTIERQDFHVFLATELWETRLDVEIAGQEVEIPADGLRGHRDIIKRALQFDSDGKLNDSNRDPVAVKRCAGQNRVHRFCGDRYFAGGGTRL